MYDVVRILGSLLIRIAFAGLATGRIASDTYAYITLNTIGSSVLAARAIVGHEWGFLLLEAVWALVSLSAQWLGKPPTNRRWCKAHTGPVHSPRACRSSIWSTHWLRS